MVIQLPVQLHSFATVWNLEPTPLLPLEEVNWEKLLLGDGGDDGDETFPRFRNRLVSRMICAAFREKNWQCRRHRPQLYCGGLPIKQGYSFTLW